MAWLRAKTSQLENDSEPGDRWAYRAFVAGHARV
jgi:hypothetical protein